jgi:hypothetical protein
LLFVVCVIPGTALSCRGIDWGMGSQLAIVWCLPTWFPWALDLCLQWCCVCEVYPGTYSSSQIWHGTLGNGIDLLLDVGRIGTLWGVMSHFIVPPFFLLRAIRAGTCGET